MKWLDLAYNLVKNHDGSSAFLVVDHDEEDMIASKAPIGNIYSPGGCLSVSENILPAVSVLLHVTDHHLQNRPAETVTEGSCWPHAPLCLHALHCASADDSRPSVLQSLPCVSPRVILPKVLPAFMPAMVPKLALCFPAAVGSGVLTFQALHCCGCWKRLHNGV